jgi:hypothetical protein
MIFSKAFSQKRLKSAVVPTHPIDLLSFLSKLGACIYVLKGTWNE